MVSDTEIDIKSLRSIAALKSLVNKELVNLGLQSPDSTEDSSLDSSSSSESSDLSLLIIKVLLRVHLVRLESIKGRKSRVKRNLE